MAWYELGASSYPDLKGQMQYTNAKRIADQFLSMKRDFDALPSSIASGDRLSANEARRSRPRQDALYANYLRNGYPIAAYPYTSRHDEVTHGNAIDVGVTMADGNNRALTTSEFAWMHDQCEKRGFTWTGVNFNEPWHIEGATRAEILAPYADIVAGAAPTTPATPKRKKSATVMRLIQNVGKAAVYAFCVETGFWEQVPNGDLLKSYKASYSIDVEQANDTMFNFWRNTTLAQRDLLAQRVWNGYKFSDGRTPGQWLTQGTKSSGSAVNILKQGDK